MSTEEKDFNKEQAQEAFRNFILAKYDTQGSSANRVFRTSRKLAYECREMCEPSLPDIAQVMTEQNFESGQFSGTYTWILYDKNELIY